MKEIEAEHTDLSSDLSGVLRSPEFSFLLLQLMYIDYFVYIIRVIPISYRRIPMYIEKPRNEIWH
jgi:hypothetical protein